jgi:hypothetical protein
MKVINRLNNKLGSCGMWMGDVCRVPFFTAVFCLTVAALAFWLGYEIGEMDMARNASSRLRNAITLITTNCGKSLEEI